MGLAHIFQMSYEQRRPLTTARLPELAAIKNNQLETKLLQNELGNIPIFASMLRYFDIFVLIPQQTVCKPPNSLLMLPLSAMETPQD